MAKDGDLSTVTLQLLGKQILGRYALASIHSVAAYLYVGLRNMKQSQQQALTIITHIKPAEISTLGGVLDEIGARPPDNALAPFSKVKAIHFAAWVVMLDEPAFQPTLAFEINHDGDREALLDDLIAHASEGLHCVYSTCVGYPAGASADALKRYLLEHVVESVAFYVGCPGQTVASVHNAIDVRREVERFLDNASTPPLDNLSAVQVHERIQRHLLETPGATPVVSPSTLADQRARAHRNIVLLALAGLPLLVLFLPLLLIWFVVLRFKERADSKAPISPRRPIDPRLLRGDVNVQNHLTTLVTVKPGAFRLYTLKGVLWLIDLLARTVFTTGHLGGIPTIHFARWLFIDGDRRLLFFSNYDGSWLSYLGDFIDRASYGLTAVWSNTVDFPPAFCLFFGGAKHVEAFERWSHEHNVFAPVWYSAYPTETIWNLQKDLELRDTIGQSLGAPEAERLLALL